MWRNTADRFGLLSIIIHWSMAVALYAMFALGLWMTGLGYYDSWYHTAPDIHKSVGIILFILLLVRLLWRWHSPVPAPLASYSVAVRRTARGAHALLYLLLLLLLVSGYLISTADGKPVSVFGWFSLPVLAAGGPQQADLAGTLHLWLAWSLVLLSALHALGAVKHHIIDRDATLRRMLGLRSRLLSQKDVS
ncbi:MAG: cytochrome b [Pantoea eucrina]|uniref:cytochrome b n=1 Tax=Pantoea sp. UBA4549 TaxID=1947033 RepID=UPI0025D68A98|nr:cytochrome b [Pantoea sp. UBA4549]MDF2784110.1 cytochrome b [Pantoea eucrina]